MVLHAYQWNDEVHPRYSQGNTSLWPFRAVTDATPPPCDRKRKYSCRYGIPVYDSLDKLDGKGDVVIDFSAPAAVEKALPYCEAHKLPIVVCTTGLSEELQLKIVQLSRSIPWALVKIPHKLLRPIQH